ncbi:MAG TPA: glycosyltransferase [Chthoniobacteraceae bacterium]|jgi:glycosyltransferase involved in cell wall biosynthesis/predicted metal-dependent phosphoesterase TrpH|nr:glycosyltransferase [Chthoniobacteraceae bacterium]
MSSKVDLHVHSRFSNRSPEWLLRRFDVPDSYTDPRKLHAILRERGMDFVTITDHDRIDGCLEIAGLPGVFISEQVTTWFPEDRCQVHILIWGLNEAQHREIFRIRENIYDLQKYLAGENLAHAVAHPLYRLDEKFARRHVERLLLLFRHFEGLNGLRDAMLSDLAQELFASLTPEKMEALANEHSLQPTHEEPWKKVLVAGSDDHSGMYPAKAWTETPRTGSVPELLQHLRAGRVMMAGEGGTPLALSHGVYKVLYSFIREKIQRGSSESSDLIEKVFSRFMEGRDPTEFSLPEKLGFLAQGIVTGKIFELAKPMNASLWKQFATIFSHSDFKGSLARETAGVAEPERRAFIMANSLANQVAYRVFTRFVKEISTGNLMESIQDISALTPILIALAPYLYAFQSQTPDRRWLKATLQPIAGSVPPALQNSRRAWFTDTLEDVNGVSNTIRRMTAAGVQAGRDLVVVTSRMEASANGIPIKNFLPIGEFELPEYELQKLAFPPVLQMVDYIQRKKFTEIIISTPGPVGLVGLIAAKTLGLRTAGIYHTDFPQYVGILTDDRSLETLTWVYMHWFYSQMDLVYVNSEHYRRCWIDRGIPAEKLRIFPRGLDTVLFNPDQRNAETRERFGARNGEPVLLYVGRISREKDLDVLAAAYARLRKRHPSTRLVFVGDGPYLKELRENLPGAIFTGYLSGADLAKAFASADVFVFPSTTDTFGNVVLEAMASGLPAIVSDTGGPRELVKNGVTGYVTRSLDVEDFTAATERLVADPGLRQTMHANALAAVQDRDWSEAFARFWSTSE